MSVLQSAAEQPDVTVAIVDDHDAIHAGVQTWCRDADPPIALTGHYTAVEPFITAHPSADNGPDVVLLDLELRSRKPDLDAVERVSGAGHRVIVYSHIVHDEVILRCLDLGANSYIAKTEGRDHLIDAIRAAAGGGALVGPRMAHAISSDSATARPNLSIREQEVLMAWFQTESKDLVARRLHISPSTVRTYLQRVRTKYAAIGRPAPTKAALVARAIQDGIVSVEEL